MAEKYKPSPEELFAAENSLTPEQKEASLVREEGYQLGGREALKERSRNQGSSSRKIEKAVVEVDPEILKLSVDTVDLGPRLTTNFQKACRINNIKTIEQLVTHSTISLRADGFGHTSFNALNKWLEERGLSLRKTTWNMTDEELLYSPEAIKQDWDIEFNLEDLFLKISDLKDKFLQAEPAHGEEIISILNKAGKITVFDLLEEHYGPLGDLFDWKDTLVKPLKDFFKKNYNIEIGYFSPGGFDIITRWRNAKIKPEQSS
jgi:hypothetical protein